MFHFYFLQNYEVVPDDTMFLEGGGGQIEISYNGVYFNCVLVIIGCDWNT